MNLIEAWKKAKEGQWVRRSVGVLTIRKRGAFHTLLHAWEYCEADLLAEDWEITKEKKTLVFENAELGGMIKNRFIQHFFDSANLSRPKIFTKIILEWEA